MLSTRKIRHLTIDNLRPVCGARARGGFRLDMFPSTSVICLRCRLILEHRQLKFVRPAITFSPSRRTYLAASD